MINSKPYVLAGAVIVISALIYFVSSLSVQKNTNSEIVTVNPRTSSSTEEIKKTSLSAKYLTPVQKSQKYDLAKEITTPDGFINTPSTSSGQATPFTISENIGKKVILVDFWTYSCINCQRTTPYLNAWYEKYKDKGLVIVGLHTPEFEFEKDYNNVKLATEKFGIKFPVVLDNDYSTWTAYRNQYWPRKYLIDIDGYIVYDHIGEGSYEETEKKIQEALEERMAVLGENGSINDSLTKEVVVVNGAKSPEIYFGAGRNQYFGNGKQAQVGEQNNLLIPLEITPNILYLEGNWNIDNEYSKNTSNNSKIVYKFSAKEVFFVAEADTETTVEVLLDGKPLTVNLGKDIIKTSDGKTVFKVKEARLYNIIKGTQTETHTLEFRIQKAGLKAFTFTFG